MATSAVWNRAPKTIKNRLLIVCFLLKKNGIQNSTKLVEMPTIEEEVPEPYTREQIESLFAYLDREGLQEEKQRYKFFLGSSLREKEVMFAEWHDIDFTKGTIRVHAKKDVGSPVGRAGEPKLGFWGGKRYCKGLAGN